MKQISLKVLLYTQKTYSDGTHPIILQYILNRKVKRKVIARCHPHQWDSKKNQVKGKGANTARINHFINSEYVKAEHDLYDIKSGDKTVSSIFKDKTGLTLQDSFDAELLRLESEFKSGYYDKMLAIQKQIPDKSILVSDIDERWFEKMIASMTKLGNNGATIKKKIKLIRGMIGRYSAIGITKEIKAVTVPTQKPLKQKLSSEEFGRLSELKLPENDLLTATRDLFVLQVYLRGIRVGDLLQAYSDDFKDDKFTYKANKTDKPMAIKLITPAISIIDIYRGKHSRLFPFFTWVYDKKKSKFENERARLKHKEACTTIVNRYLKVLAVMADIKKPLSSHIARHTFARMAIDKINNPMITMDLLNHSSLKDHQQYLNDIRKEDELNKAADDIFG
ncbi:tyrosine-type recombinase/integrase [Mucilaginibacter sabulilitoris]|uniref:Tyrosine-type recombinase/integrase n=1 Tax=Mucilaginibacter sabulilitoris TaxID=1173583 RepID=A0ABZ0TJR0_9SPHI|nr:tyrosine-type recombinase/integrase [Mucilaginibacter sabulilitoris]WPU91775.1 tyrosine-type recombinase/integrase [Mucilaginibacter sabulilitoris]